MARGLSGGPGWLRFRAWTEIGGERRGGNKCSDLSCKSKVVSVVCLSVGMVAVVHSGGWMLGDRIAEGDEEGQRHLF